MRMLAGLIAPTSGAVVIDGVHLTRATGTLLRSRIGFLTEAPGVWDRLTVHENLRVYAGLYGLANPNGVIDRALELFELRDRASTRAAELSKGMRQKVALARALPHEPRILLLDEPTSGLDPEITRSVRALLDDRRAAGCSILLSTHNLDEAERLADRVAVLHGRLLALDSPAVLRQRLRTGRVIVCLAGDPAAHLDTARRFDRDTSVDGNTIVLRLASAEHDTPALVSALAAAGARIVEVRQEVPALEDAYLLKLSGLMGTHDELSGDGRIQLFLFEQFLLLFLVIPITGAMALAAHAVVGEKQARTLEPLLATPITTFELLVAKVLGALIPTSAVSLVGLALYVLGIVLLAEPGVASAMASVRTAVLVLVVAPAAALVSLQGAIVISSRVNDARTAQQFGVMIIIPLSALLVAQFMGHIWLSASALALIGLGLFGGWLLLTALSVVIFER